MKAELHPSKTVRIAFVGKYLDLQDAYKSLTEAIKHAGIQTDTRVEVSYIDAEEVERSGTGCLTGVSAILVPGGFGRRGFEGKIAAAGYAREKDVPYLGICYGLHAAVIDFARHRCHLEGAHSTEIEEKTEHPVIALVTEWTGKDGQVEQRAASTDLGGSMRLGEQACLLNQGSLAQRVYGKSVVHERHRHRYEVNDRYVQQMTDAGMAIAGRSEDGLVEMVELPEHRWFLACQFHPEFTSSPREGHPLFKGFIEAALSYAADQAQITHIQAVG